MSSLLPTGGDTCEVSAYTFDDLVDRFGLPSLVKMDIEGAEALVLDEVSSRCCELGAALLVSLHGPYWPPGWAPDLSRFGKLTVLEAVGGFSVLLGEP